MSPSSDPADNSNNNNKDNNNNNNKDDDTASSKKPEQSESEVYDRQIRLWGADAQAKMSKTKVLYIHMTGATSEILKNLVLAGIRPAVCDPRLVVDSKRYLQQTPSFFWAGRQDISNSNNDDDDRNKKEKDNDSNNNETPPPPPPPSSKKMKLASTTTIAEWVQPSIEDLNPLLGPCELVPVHHVSDLTTELLEPFKIVVASRITPTLAMELQKKLTAAQKLFWVDTFGWYGCCWVDFMSNQHQYRAEKGKDLLDPTTISPYVSLPEMYQVPLHLALMPRHKGTPPPSLVYHKAILAFVDYKQAWPPSDGGDSNSCLDGNEFVQFIREQWLPQTLSPSLLSNDLFAEAALLDVARQATCEMIPICSVMGGMVGNEIIKAISGKGEPANNTILFDGPTSKGWFYLLQDKSKEPPKK